MVYSMGGGAGRNEEEVFEGDLVYFDSQEV